MERIGAKRRLAVGGKIRVEGYSFRSERELAIYWGLKKMVKAGRVSDCMEGKVLNGFL